MGAFFIGIDLQKLFQKEYWFYLNTIAPNAGRWQFIS